MSDTVQKGALWGGLLFFAVATIICATQGKFGALLACVLAPHSIVDQDEWRTWVVAVREHNVLPFPSNWGGVDDWNVKINQFNGSPDGTATNINATTPAQQEDLRKALETIAKLQNGQLDFGGH